MVYVIYLVFLAQRRRKKKALKRNIDVVYQTDRFLFKWSQADAKQNRAMLCQTKTNDKSFR